MKTATFTLKSGAAISTPVAVDEEQAIQKVWYAYLTDPASGVAFNLSVNDGKGSIDLLLAEVAGILII